MSQHAKGGYGQANVPFLLNQASTKSLPKKKSDKKNSLQERVHAFTVSLRAWGRTLMCPVSAAIAARDACDTCYDFGDYCAGWEYTPPERFTSPYFTTEPELSKYEASLGSAGAASAPARDRPEPRSRPASPGGASMSSGADAGSLPLRSTMAMKRMKRNRSDAR